MHKCSRWVRLFTFFIILLSPLIPVAWAGSGLTPTMSVDQIRPGMKGYGLTVFQGTTIEPFAIEVVSVMTDAYPGLPGWSGAQRDLIWIICPDERMRISGPVAGMSGSPIYVWGDDEPQVPGQGGKLIGAFAYGSTGSQVCYVGVQPIAYMRQIPTRIKQADQAAAGKTKKTIVGVSDSNVNTSNARPRLSAKWTYDTLLSIAYQNAIPAYQIDRLKLLAPLFGRRTQPNDLASMVDSRHTSGFGSDGQGQNFSSTQRFRIRLPDQVPGYASRMMIPISLPSSQFARALSPLFHEMGLAPTAMAGAGIAVKPPRWIDASQVKLEPGSTIAMPLAYGDMDLGGIGTVTDVLPDGTVLSLGHFNDGWGDTAMPMGTGYIHYVLSHIVASHKVGSSMNIVGTILRDENTGSAGTSEIRFTDAPVTVRVNVPQIEPKTYHYRVAHHPKLTPILGAILLGESARVVLGLPLENTVTLDATITFQGNRTLKLRKHLPLGDPLGIMLEVYPAMLAMSANPFERVQITSIDADINVTRDVLLASIKQGRIDKLEASPGESLHIWLKLQKYGGQIIDKAITFRLPKNLPAGQYDLLITDQRGYTTARIRNRPHLASISNVDELFQTVALYNSVPDDALFVTMVLPDQGMAIGRMELPKLPSSQQALIASPTSTLATPFKTAITQTIKMGMVVQGSLRYKITVTAKPTVQ